MPQLALCVSLGIHSISVVLPALDPSPPLDMPEPELPEPLSVVPLPIQDKPPLSTSQPPIEQPVPQPVLVPEEAIEPELVEPEPIEPDSIELEPIEPEPIESDPIEPDPVEPESSNEPIPQIFDSTNTDPADPSGYVAFSETLQSLDNSIIARNIRDVTYDLNYLGDLCFSEESGLSGSLAIALENPPRLTTGKIVTSTGYGEINQAIERWFTQLQSGQIGDTDELASAAGVTLYDWIQQTEGEWFLNGETYEAYFFNITVNLVNNPCL